MLSGKVKMNNLDFAPHKASLINYANRAVGRNVGEDLVQDTLIKAIRSAHNFDGANLGGWLMSILKSRIADYWRETNRRPISAGEVDDLVDMTIEPTYSDEFQFDTFGSLERLVRQLSADHQQILFLTHVTGLSDKEAANILGVAVNTIATRRARAHAQLRRLVEEVGA